MHVPRPSTMPTPGHVLCTHAHNWLGGAWIVKKVRCKGHAGYVLHRALVVTSNFIIDMLCRRPLPTRTRPVMRMSRKLHNTLVGTLGGQLNTRFVMLVGRATRFLSRDFGPKIIFQCYVLFLYQKYSVMHQDYSRARISSISLSYMEIFKIKPSRS